MIGQGVIIRCPDKDLVSTLFDIFVENGVGWYGNEPMTTTYWSNNGEYTCYRISRDHSPDNSLRYGSIDCYSDSEYDDYIKCTFYGAEPDFEISDAGFEAIISAGGVTKGGKSHVGQAV